MALIVSPFGGGTLIGKLGSTVFQRGPFGNLARTFVKPVNPNTPRQVSARAVMQQLAAAWTATLTDTQRKDWGTYAAATPIINKTGQTVFYSGRTMFIRTQFLNVDANGIGALDAVAPLTGGLAQAPIPNLSFTAATGVLDVTAIDSGPAVNFDINFLVSPTKGEQVNYYKGPFSATVFADEATILPLNLATFGAVPVGTKVFVQSRIWDTDTRKLSQPDIFVATAV